MQEPFILFQVAGATYAVSSAHVQQVEMIENITPVPNAPPFVDGIVYLRGQVVPVINLRMRFGMDKTPYDLYSRLIILNLEKRVIAIAVDSAREFLKIDLETLLPPPESLVGPGVEYLDGILPIDDRLILVVNLHRLLSDREVDSLPETEQSAA